MPGSHPVRPLHGLQLLMALLAAAGVLAFIGACNSGGGGGGGGGGGASAAASTGSVAVLLTDGPVDPHEFKHIYVTYIEIILIGEPGQVTIFKGKKTVDLRDLEDVSKLATVGRDVPAGWYEKIRLLIEEIELVPADGSDPIFLSKAPNKLPPKIDLNPRERFRVRAGKLLLLQIDIVGGESIHIVETGKADKYQFRPVVFVDILTGPLLGKLVLLQGVVENVDDEDGEFDLCRTHPVSRPKDGERYTRDPDEDDGEDGEDGDDERDHCVEVVARFEGNKTSFFDENGDPTSFDVIDDGDQASVLGRFIREEDDGDDDGERDDEDLVFEAEVVQLGDPLAIDGVAATTVDADDQFVVDPDPGQGISDDPLPVQLQMGTKVFTRRGLPLAPSKIQVDDPVRVTGVLDTSPSLFRAAFVMVDIKAADGERIEGIIVEDPEFGGALLQVLTDAGEICVEVPEEARVFEIGEGQADAIDRSELEKNDRLNIFGEAGETPDDCFLAETVISFGDDPVLEPLSSLLSGTPSLALPTSVPTADEDERDEGGASMSAGAVEVYEIGPDRIEAGLIWVKLPGDEASEAASQ